MINKVYEKIKEYIRENKLFILTIIVIIILSVVELPYYINAPGGLIKLDDKIKIKDEYKPQLKTNESNHLNRFSNRTSRRSLTESRNRIPSNLRRFI